MAQRSRSGLSSWLHLLITGGACGLLAACQLVVPSSLDEVACTQEGQVGPPACPSGQQCRGGTCVACVGDECSSAQAGGEGGSGSEGGSGGEGGTEQAGEGGTEQAGDAGSEQAGDGGSEPGGESGAGGDAGAGGESGKAGMSGAGGQASAGGKGGSNTSGTSGQGGEAGSAHSGSGGSEAGGAGGAVAGAGGSEAGAGQGGGAGGAGAGGAGAAGAPPVPGKIGKSCDPALGCEGNLSCSSWSALGYAKGGNVCTTPCCDSSQCLEFELGAVCAPTNVGGVCLSAADAGRGVPGQKGKGLDCEGSSECRSGWCEAGFCNDLCCGDTCGSGKSCQRRDVPGSPSKAFACGPAPSGGKAAGENSGPCAKDTLDPTVESYFNHSSCLSLTCGGFEKKGLTSNLLPYTETFCTKTCTSSSQCGGLADGLSSAFCDYRQLEGGWVRVCLEGGGFGFYDTPVGSGCESDEDCISHHCVSSGGAKYCTDVCATDGDCGGGTLCTPVTLDGGNTFRLRCFKD